MDDVAELDRLLARGADQARAVSGPKLEEVKRRMGLLLPRGEAARPLARTAAETRHV